MDLSEPRWTSGACDWLTRYWYSERGELFTADSMRQKYFRNKHRVIAIGGSVATESVSKYVAARKYFGPRLLAKIGASFGTLTASRAGICSNLRFPIYFKTIRTRPNVIRNSTIGNLFR